MDTPPNGPIRWDRVRARLPGTAADLLAEIQQACEQSPENPSRAIERRLRARLAELQARFDAVAGAGS